MRVLSLFDGVSCGRVALERADIKVDKYYSSEIDKYAMKIAMKNYPDTVQIGDVTKVNGKDYEGIDLLIGGSPCTGFSVAGKGLNFEDPQSKLFFEFIRILKEANPKYFLLENVSMKQEWQDVITGMLGVPPVVINSNLLSAQNRKRLYWTNIPGVTIPEDKGILLKEIVHETRGDNIDLEKYKVPIDKSFVLLEKEVLRGKIGFFRKDCQANRVYTIHGKSVTLCGAAGGGAAGGGAAKMGQYLFGCITPDRINKRQNGQRFSEGDKFYTLTAQDQHGILTEGYIRKLTPIEAERLQTLPDNYTQCEGVPEAQRYKVCGNGWTVDVIAHIFRGLI